MIFFLILIIGVLLNLKKKWGRTTWTKFQISFDVWELVN
jgi:hypothetical protein